MNSTMAAWPMTVFFYFLDIEPQHWISNSRNPYQTDILFFFFFIKKKRHHFSGPPDTKSLFSTCV